MRPGITHRLGSSLAAMQDQALAIPANLASAAVDQPVLQRWVAGLPETVAALCDRWALTPEAPFEPGGTCSWVAPVLRRPTEPFVLKVTWPHAESRDEACGLRTWNGNGAVRLHDEEHLGATTAMLLERCIPGTPAAQLLSEREQDDVLGSLLPRLWAQPVNAQDFRPLSDMCDEWADEFEARLLNAPAHLDATLAADGIATFRGLARDGTNDVLLCTDLHAGNILASEREPWLVVDPKPYVGDRTYDALQHMLNCWPRLSEDPHGLVARLAGVLDLDRSRLQAWLFSRCVVASLDWPVLNPIACLLAP